MASRNVARSLAVGAALFTAAVASVIVAHGSPTASVLVVVTLLALLVYRSAGRAMRPMTSHSPAIRPLPPHPTGGTDVAERERTFIHLASHELRSPIAVIRGSMEVALSHPDVTPALRPHLLRAEQSAKGMEDLAELLLTLAREPERALRDLQPVDVAHELPAIVADYAFIAKDKELTLLLEIDAGLMVSAPPQILRTLIGNLLRNAIENSDRGCVRIHAGGPTTVVVEDSGHGMTDAEMAALHARIIRSGYTGTAGIGLGLISRICTHFGWSFEITSSPQAGTRASVDFAPAAGRAIGQQHQHGG
ncbi:sensor histidine kinase [Stenotrophomonas sp. PD6]|uniref:sensor histidine kinase n=1 Tax=Stenotrophomonas sp. PD6 TaxID=3368612 RepID=UPI003BA1C21B